MKQFYVKSALALVFAAGIFSACKKDKELSKTELLTTKSWRISDFGYYENGAMRSQYENNTEDCEKDDSFLFKSDKSFVQDNGSIRCSPTEAATEANGVWALSADENTLTIKGTEYYIMDLTASSLLIKEKGSGPRIDYTNLVAK